MLPNLRKQSDLAPSRKSLSSSAASSYQISVGVRIRPSRSPEMPSSLDITTHLQPNHLMHPETTQDSMYSTLIKNHMMPSLRDNFSTSMIAYGQTGSGKTHTIFGPEGCLRPDKSIDWGLMPRLLRDLMEEEGVSISVSAVEVYQDLAYDLMNNSAPLTVGTKGRDQHTETVSGAQMRKVKVAGPLAGQKGASSGGAHPAGCYCCYCERAKMKKQEDFKKMMAERRGEPYFGKGVDPFKDGIKTKKKSQLGMGYPNRARRSSNVDYATVGEKVQMLQDLPAILAFCRTVELSRASASHDLNERSSRSHCLVTVHVISTVGSKTVHNKCLLVDLAGSERIAKSKVEGVEKAQAIEINKSLSALGRVVKSLAAKNSHVPYRDSTLTMLLKDSFGGRASTTVVVCVSGVEAHDEETVRSLQFGERLGGVRRSMVARNAGVSEEHLEGGKAEMEARLRVMKAELEGLDPGGVDPSATNPAAIRKFEKDSKRLNALGDRLKAAEASEYDAGRKGGGDVATLREQWTHLNDDVERVKGAVDRLTKRQFWREPSKAWQRKDREIRELEGRIMLIK
ncbi:hypothetical protein TrLO_g8517 [Triparma laevis f. longispina]|uniref:Kinesin motor domain-containing protein n=1 Tax=Triparma laevis f. longispina TaxID=1714387 RepID=A0A9W7F3F0_9STRA|nr:hypothetical protein TrLO_g8517 [Triparma laevis f. longispina]